MAFYWSGYSLHSFCFYARVFLPLAGVSLSKPTRSLPRAFAHSRIMMSRYSNKGDKRGGEGDSERKWENRNMDIWTWVTVMDILSAL